jgi:hypothetical protein
MARAFSATRFGDIENEKTTGLQCRVNATKEPAEFINVVALVEEIVEAFAKRGNRVALRKFDLQKRSGLEFALWYPFAGHRDHRGRNIHPQNAVARVKNIFRERTGQFSSKWTKTPKPTGLLAGSHRS